MNISEKFAELRADGEHAFITYVCSGDPKPNATRKIVRSLVNGGADIVELGLPFSDPVADGPTIQAAAQRALNAGMNTDIYFEVANSIGRETPLICMTYYNPIFRRGLERFTKDCANSGISGIIVPDLPIEESGDLRKACFKHGLSLVLMVAPTTTDERIKRIEQNASGFLYLVSRLGVTGTSQVLSSQIKSLLDRVKSNIPKAVGFGVSKPEHARYIVKAGADGVIVGSALIDIIASGQNVNKRLELLASKLKSGMVI